MPSSPEWVAFYNSKEWKRARRAQLSREPLCRKCTDQERIEPATDVDHVVPLEEGGAPLDRKNLQSLCHPCHSSKTRAAQTGRDYDNAIGNDGYPLDKAHPFNR